MKKESQPNDSTKQPAKVAEKSPGKSNRFAFLHTKKFKIIAGVVGALTVLAVLLLIPATRYGLLGPFIKRDVTIQVVDSATGQSISNAEVSVAGRNSLTDEQGKARFTAVSVGQYQAVIKKKYYADYQQSVEIPIFGDTTQLKTTLTATGRQVSIRVVDRINGQPLAKAVVTALETSATTTEAGEATLVLPADKTTEEATIKLDGFNELAATITITEQEDDKNTFALTPAGYVYYLSNRTGKVNVMKAQLDGGNPSVVIEGTGNENPEDTVLLAARDWRYLALRTTREGSKSKLFLLNTQTDRLSVMDEGDVGFQPVGWYNEYFIYTVIRDDAPNTKAGKELLKSFNANTGKITILDEAAADFGGINDNDYNRETYTQTYILDNEIVFTKDWIAGPIFPAESRLPSKKMSIYSVRPTGESKRSIRDFPASGFITARLYKPQEVYFAVQEGEQSTYYEYEHGSLQPDPDINQDSFYKSYPTYLVSPSGEHTFWAEGRDGKLVLLIGNKAGEEAKEAGVVTELTPYGWFTENYLLVSKRRSELFIVPIQQASDAAAIKITDYLTPSFSYSGYGYGYGGL